MFFFLIHKATNAILSSLFLICFIYFQIPEFLENGQPFPYRNLILFITFVVILLTLIVQGLTLPKMIEKVGFYNFNETNENDERVSLKRSLSEACLNFVRTKMGDEILINPVLKRSVENWEEKLANPEKTFLSEEQKQNYLQFLEMQRKFLIEKNASEPNLNEDVVRRQQHLIDLEEERVHHS